MTKLPAKNVLDGSKLPKTTTGEMKDAFGKLRDYLNELLGEDSADKEAARLALGIDLAELTGKQNVIEIAIQDKVDKTEWKNRIQKLEEEIAKRGIPIGTIVMFTASEVPAGYLKADGSAVGRETYPDLYAAIGTTYGAGDGLTTFNLPDLIGRFAEGSAVPGTVKEAGLPNIAGQFYCAVVNSHSDYAKGAFTGTDNGTSPHAVWANAGADGVMYGYNFNAFRSNPIYGASNTVQPPALTLLPCIKAFHA